MTTANAPSPPPSPPREWPPWRVAIAAISSAALALSAYLTWHHLTGGPVIGCDGSAACDDVLGSRWSSVGGVVPVSALAAGAYLAMLLATFSIGPKSPPADRRLAWAALLALAGAAVGGAVWFTLLQRYSVGALCKYCMTLHAAGVTLAVLVAWGATRQRIDGSPPLRATRAVAAMIVGLLAAAALAGAQLALKPRAALVAGETARVPTTAEAAPATEPLAPPMVGATDAPHVVTVLFDYRCRHCQEFHAMLEDAVRHFRGTVAFALRPAPLNNRCNPFVTSDAAEFRESCDLARLAMAVYVADRPAYSAFDRWLFESEPDQLWRGRKLDVARAKAIEMIGQSRLDAALADPRVGELLAEGIRLFGATIGPNQAGSAVPKFVYGNHWMTPGTMGLDEFVASLHDDLGVPSP